MASYLCDESKRGDRGDWGRSDGDGRGDGIPWMERGERGRRAGERPLEVAVMGRFLEVRLPRLVVEKIVVYVKPRQQPFLFA